MDTTQILNNLENSDLIKSVSKVYGDKVYITLTSKANSNASDRRNQIYLDLNTGNLWVKKLANGLYKETLEILDQANLVNKTI